MIGNLAGVVEWANEAFGRLTGIPLAETVNKPVAQLLERVGIDVEVVRFVAEHFLEGRVCRVELPFERPDGRTIDVLLEVVALRDACGEIERFHAFASEVAGDEEQAQRTAGPTPGERFDEGGRIARGAGPCSPDALAPPDPHRHNQHQNQHQHQHQHGRTLIPLEISREVAHIAAAYRGAPLLDLALTDGLPPIEVPREDFDALVGELLRNASRAIDASGTSWGTITVATGRARPGRRYHSPVHVKPLLAPRSRASEAHDRTLLEVHDTGAPLDPAIRSRAFELAGRIGASIHFDAMPGCGNQVVVLFAT